MRVLAEVVLAGRGFSAELLALENYARRAGLFRPGEMLD